MQKAIPRIYFNRSNRLGIEVMNFAELLVKLNQSNNHDPFSVHRIEFFFILVVTKGSYTHFVDFKSYELSEGSALFVAKNQVHHFTEGLRAFDGYCVVFNLAFVDKGHFITDYLQLNRLFNYHIESPVIHQSELGQDSLISAIAQLHDEYTFADNLVKVEILHALLHVLLLKAERAKAFQSVRGVKPHWLKTFNQFKGLLEQNYANTRKSRTYASELLVSYKFLNDVVKKLTGKTVKTFIDDYVTIEIKRYLASTALSVKEIGYQTGFEEPTNLVKFFKKNTTTTPLEFRRQF